MGLNFLDKINVHFCSFFTFPKIVKSLSRTQDDVIDFFLKVHNFDVPNHSEFQSVLKPEICALLRVGQCYVPIARSRSADLFIRLAEAKKLVEFQFKNFMKPIAQEVVDVEVEKSAVAGWEVTLVIVCSSGFTKDGKKGEEDMSYYDSKNEVLVVILCKSSVSAFLGETNLQAISSSGEVENSMARLEAAKIWVQNKKMRVDPESEEASEID
jgi:hypothetical protein